MDEESLKKQIRKTFKKDLEEIGAESKEIYFGEPPSPADKKILRRIGRIGKNVVFVVIAIPYMVLSIWVTSDEALIKFERRLPKQYEQVTTLFNVINGDKETFIKQDSIPKEDSAKQTDKPFYIVLDEEWRNNPHSFEQYQKRISEFQNPSNLPNDKSPFNRPAPIPPITNSTYVSSGSVSDVSLFNNSDWAIYDPNKNKT